MDKLKFIILLSILFANASLSQDIFIIADPRVYNEMAISNDLTLERAIRRDLSNSEKFYIVIARRYDIWYRWCESFTKQGPSVINDAVSIIQQAMKDPVYRNVDAFVAELQKKIMIQNGGVVPRLHFLSRPNASLSAINAIPQTTVGDMHASRSVNNQKIQLTDWPRVIFTITLIMICLFAVALVFYFFRKKIIEERENYENYVISLRDQVHGKLIDISKRFPELAESFNKMLFLLLIILICSNDLAKANEHRITVIDVSGSFYNKLPEIKKEIALKMISGYATELVIFGDSTRSLGVVRSYAQLDSIFTNIPKDQNTRLSDAIGFIVSKSQELRNNGIKAYVTFFSDFLNDDNGMDASKGIPILNNYVPIDTSTNQNVKGVKGFVKDNRSFTFYGFLIAIFLILMFLLTILFTKIREKTDNNKISCIQKLVVISQKVMKEFPIKGAEFCIKVGPEIDSDVRLFIANSLNLSSSVEDRTITLKIQPVEEVLLNNDLKQLKEDNHHDNQY